MGRSLTASSPRAAYVGGFFGHDNLGDEALYDAVELLFSGCSILKYPRKLWLINIAKILPRVHFAILGGGTLINQIESWRLQAERCFDLFSPSFVFGTGVGDPAFWSSEPGWEDTLAKWKTILERCDYVGVRGPRSAELLADAGLDDVEGIGDPALVFAGDELPGDDSYVPDSLGLNIGQAGGVMWGDEGRVLEQYVRLAGLAKKAGWRVKWFVVYPADLEITKRAAGMSETSEEIYETYTDVGEYLELVRPLSTFVGMKLHATALATCTYVPSVMVEYRPKCRDFMRAIGQDEATVRSDVFEAEQVWEVVSAWNSNRSGAAGALYNAIGTLSKAQKARAREITQSITRS